MARELLSVDEKARRESWSISVERGRDVLDGLSRMCRRSVLADVPVIPMTGEYICDCWVR